MSILTADAVIIGAGGMGCSTAYSLIKRGFSRVIVLEKSFIASGTTGKSSAIVRQHYTAEPLAKLALKAVRAFQSFEDEFGGTSGFVPCGYIVMVNEDDKEALTKNVAIHQSLGIQVHLIDRSTLKEMVPQINTDDVSLAAYEPDSGYGDPVQTTNAIADAARKRGAIFQLQTEATGILRHPDGSVMGVLTSNGDEIHSPVVVDTGGPWAGKVGKLVNKNIPIRPTREQILLFGRPGDFGNEHPILSDLIQLAYFRPETGGMTLVGNSDPQEHMHGESDPDLYDQGVDEANIEKMLEKLCWRLPAMENGDIRRGYSGIYENSPDFNPIMDTFDDIPGFYFACGFSGHGYKYIPIVGDLMADMILTGQRTEELFPFRLSRYDEGKPIRGTYTYSMASTLR